MIFGHNATVVHQNKEHHLFCICHQLNQLINHISQNRINKISQLKQQLESVIIQ